MTSQVLVQLNFQAPMKALHTSFEALNPYIFGVAFLLVLSGYYAHVWRKRTNGYGVIESIALIGLAVMFAGSISFWRPYAVNLFYWPAEELGRQSPTFQLHLAINNFLHNMSALMQDTASQPQTSSKGFFHFAWNFTQITEAALTDLLAKGIVFLLSIVAALLALPFFYLQHVLVEVLFAFMPIAICALIVPALHSRAMSYLSMTASVLAWPLGFAIVAAAANLVFQIPFTGQVNDNSQVLQVGFTLIGPIFQLIIAAFLMIFGTLLVPPTMFYLFSYGGTHFDPVMSGVRSLPLLGGLAKR